MSIHPGVLAAAGAAGSPAWQPSDLPGYSSDGLDVRFNGPGTTVTDGAVADLSLLTGANRELTSWANVAGGAAADKAAGTGPVYDVTNKWVHSNTGTVRLLGTKTAALNSDVQTLALVVRLASAQSNWSINYYLGDSIGGAGGFRIEKNGAGTAANLVIKAGGIETGKTIWSGLYDDTWHRLVLRFNAGALDKWIDGVKSASDTYDSASGDFTSAGWLALGDNAILTAWRFLLHMPGAPADADIDDLNAWMLSEMMP